MQSNFFLSKFQLRDNQKSILENSILYEKQCTITISFQQLNNITLNMEEEIENSIILPLSSKQKNILLNAKEKGLTFDLIFNLHQLKEIALFNFNKDIKIDLFPLVKKKVCRKNINYVQ